MFTLSEVVPWGRSFDEYCRMFALTTGDLSLRILGCADGPASFNAEATRRGVRVVSCDPIFQFDSDHIRQRIRETFDLVLDQTRHNADAFHWDVFSSVEELGQQRQSAMATFLADIDAGKRVGRYVAAALPSLPFADGSFDLALCSHFLFLYSEHFDNAFHLAAIEQMCRVAKEVRVFPLLALSGYESPHVASVSKSLQELHYNVSMETVPYEFQRGGNRMMRVHRRQMERQGSPAGVPPSSIICHR